MKYMTIWFAVMFVASIAYFATGYCDDDAPQAPGDSGVTDAVTQRFVKPSQMYTEKKDTAEPAKVEETKKMTETAAAENKKKIEDIKKASVAGKLKAAKKKLKAKKVEDAGKVQDFKAVDNNHGR